MKAGPEKAGVPSQEFAVVMLLVSEDDQVLSSLGRALEKFNVRCVAAFSQDQAERQLRASKVDGVILDFDEIALATAVLRMMLESKMNSASMIIATVGTAGAAREAFQRGATLTIPRLQSVDQLTRCLRSSYYLVLRNKRASIRFPLDKEIHISQGQQAAMEGRVTNLSETGLKLICRPSLEKGTMLDIAFQLPNAANVKAKIQVIWSDDNGEAGAQFMKFEEEGLKRIQEWINTMLLGRLS